MKRIICAICLCVVLTGCSPALFGGGSYKYESTTADGRMVSLEVESNREVAETLKFNMNPDTGEVSVETGGIGAGPNNLQPIMDAFVKALIQALAEIQAVK